jgi:hypothetical protein
VGDWFEDAVGSQRIAEEVERCIGEVMGWGGVQEECGKMDGQGQGGDEPRRDLGQEHCRVRSQVFIKLLEHL